LQAASPKPLGNVSEARPRSAARDEQIMLTIRMRRTGSKKRPFFRVVVSEARSKKEGEFVEVLGFYNPRTKPAVVEINKARINHWISKGARPTDSVRTLLAKHLTRDRAVVEAPVTAEPTAPRA
jgi:small subunit ribosomal protein S16